ncbi:MAG: DUF1786 domain-containing protein [Candidatus Bathyarchaeota archaeon]|nr:DUF1786 domain-containing protein [Candidatus Bathyarchaeota archaeon]
MKILAIDIGAGTEDVLLYDDSKKSVENCIKMVLPSPCNIFASQVKSATRLLKDLFVKGDTIGGGPFSHALKRHVEAGLRVFMTEQAAYTVRNSLEQVKEAGIEIVDESGPKDFVGETIVLEEVNINKIGDFLKGFGESFSDIEYVAVAVQDHGVFPEGMTNRQFRINKIKELLSENPKPEAFAFKEDEIPQCYPRMKSAVQACKRQLPNATVLLMDTSPDAILGCLLDPAVKGADPLLAVNVGNGHTMAAIISNGEITAVLEHHTRLLDPTKMEILLRDFAEGKLSNDQVFDDNGHGMFYLEDAPGFSCIKKVVVTGPNRNILADTDLDVHFATPGGDVMMSGTFGLVEATKRKFLKS